MAGKDVLVTIQDDEALDITVAPVDAEGRAAKLDGAPQYASSDPNVIDVQPTADGLGCALVSGQPGDADVTITADADLGAGVTTLTYTIGVKVVAAQAVGLGVVLGTARKK